MAYMSYCRFEGTLHELKCCLNDVEEHINEEANDTVSEHEIACFEDMVKTFYEFLCEQELIDEDGELDTDRLSEIGDAMEKSYREDDWE